VTAESSCPNCGATAVGSYCSSCGTKLGASAGSASLETTMGGVLGKDRYGVYRIVRALILAPVTTTIKLTFDEGFTKYFKPLFAVVAAKASAFFVTFPTILRDVFGRDANPSAKDAIEVTRYIAREYICLAILFFISYFVYRAVSPNTRGPSQFAKFAAISATVFALIDIATGLLIYAGALVLGRNMTDAQFDVIYYGLDGLDRILTLIFFAAVSCRFWQINWVKSLAVTILLALLNWKLIEPLVRTVV
jgi:hypothetical protein